MQIWVSSPHNGSGYYGLKDEINDALSREHFKAVVQGGGDVSVHYARTGYLGFMMKSEKTDRQGGEVVSMYVIVIFIKVYFGVSSSLYVIMLIAYSCTICTQGFT